MTEVAQYTQNYLEDQARNFIKNNKPQEYKKMSKKDLAEYCTLKANAARTEAESLITSGVWDQEAWNRAIRSQILESETD